MLIRPRLRLKTTNTVVSVGLVPGQRVPAGEAQQERHSEGGDHHHHQYDQGLDLYVSLHGVTRCNSG